MTITLGGLWPPRPAPAQVLGGVERCHFHAPCPNCGTDCQWMSIRTNTRVEHVTRCGCGGA